MVKIKRVYDAVSRDDGKRILVDRLWPRGITKEAAQVDEWIKEIAPTDALRKWFAHDPAKWQEFRRRYRTELVGKEDIIRTLRSDAKKGPVTLLYGAKDTEHNNAVVLREIMAR